MEEGESDRPHTLFQSIQAADAATIHDLPIQDIIPVNHQHYRPSGPLWSDIGLLDMGGNVRAQPANDNCADAISIDIPANAYAYGTFNSDTVSLMSATTELGEHFASGQPNSKSVWYRFSLPNPPGAHTARSTR